jgi:hypothetical protein
MKRKVLALFLLFCTAVSAAADSTSPNPLDTTELMAWLTAGISGKRLIRLVHEHGLAVAPTASEIQQLAAAAADKDLIMALTDLKPVAAHAPRMRVPKALLQAAENTRSSRYHEAETSCERRCDSSPRMQPFILHWPRCFASRAMGRCLRRTNNIGQAYARFSRKLQRSFLRFLSSG